MSLKKTSTLVIVCLSLGLLSGCSDLFKAPLYSQTQADEKFLKICKEEFGYDVIAKTAGNTQWIYMPIKESIFILKANKKTAPPPAEENKKKFAVQFLDGRFKDKNFFVEYDIIPATKPPKDNGYGNTYSEEYTKKQNNILTAISRAYVNVEKIPGEFEFADPARNEQYKKLINSHIQRQKAPDFFIVVIADITSGIETKGVFYLQDFTRYMTQEMPYEEYAKRYISEINGNEAIIGDLKGNHLEYKEISWEEFLTKQILNRITFKYQTSDFPPGDNTPVEISRIVAEATTAYNFNYFSGLKLLDLRTNDTYLFDKSQLSASK